jgi:hypothetical protein
MEKRLCQTYGDGAPLWDRSVRPFSQQDEVMLPVLVMLRRLQLTAWLASHGSLQLTVTLSGDA